MKPEPESAGTIPFQIFDVSPNFLQLMLLVSRKSNHVEIRFSSAETHASDAQ